MDMPLPKDPVMLLSVVNTWLRDRYASPEELCDDKDISLDELNAKLSNAGFEYDPENRQYR